MEVQRPKREQIEKKSKFLVTFFFIYILVLQSKYNIYMPLGKYFSH